MPAAKIASTQGGVRPTWLQGSSVTYSVLPRAAAPAFLRATTSAWSSPAVSWKPSARIVPSASAISAPTCGFGVGSPPAPSSKARNISSLSRSFTRSLTALGSYELVHLDHELVDVAEGPINAGKSYICHVVERFQTLHHAFADDQRGYFLLAALCELALQSFGVLF